MYRYNNPALNKLSEHTYSNAETATYGGIALKTVYFAFLTMISAVISFVFSMEFALANSQTFIILLIVAPLAAFICAMIAAFKPFTTPVTGSLYAVLQGLTIGFISLLFESSYGGVVFAALISTVTVLLIMLVLYSTGIIRVGAFFKKFMMSALIGIVVSQLLIFIIGLFSPSIYVMFYGNSNLAILISVIMVVFASLMILFDLQRITEVVENRLDKRYEWSAAFGLIITIIWLYMEFLKLFARIASRRR